MTNRNLVSAVLAILAFVAGYMVASSNAQVHDEGGRSDTRRCVALAAPQGLLFRAFDDGTVEYLNTLTEPYRWQSAMIPIDYATLLKDQFSKLGTLFTTSQPHP